MMVVIVVVAACRFVLLCHWSLPSNQSALVFGFLLLRPASKCACTEKEPVKLGTEILHQQAFYVPSRRQ